MKKKLEAELMSIAHRILKLKGREDIAKLHLEAQKVTEALAVLKFYEDHVALVSKEISEENFNQQLTSMIEKSEDNQMKVTDDSVDLECENISAEQEIVETLDLKITESETKGIREIQLEQTNVNPTQIKTPKNSNKKGGVKQISLEDFLVNDYVEPEFIKVENVPAEVEQALSESFEKISESVNETSKTLEVDVNNTHIDEVTNIDLHEESSFEKEVKISTIEVEEIQKIAEDNTKAVSNDEQLIELSQTFKASETIAEKGAYKTLSLNDRLTKGISIGLNDRIAFVKNLFGGSNEDYNRVMSQLNTIDNYPESVSFIENMVKPDYNDWVGNDEYVERFMQAVEKKFL